MDIRSASLHIVNKFEIFDKDKDGWINTKELEDLANQNTNGSFSNSLDRDAARTLLNNPETLYAADKTSIFQSRDGYMTKSSLNSVALKSPGGLNSLSLKFEPFANNCHKNQPASQQNGGLLNGIISGIMKLMQFGLQLLSGLFGR